MANAPDMCALHEATHFLNQDASDVTILSIGTTTTEFTLKPSLGRQLGSWNWMSRGRLFSTVVSAQQQLIDYILKHDLGDRYFRIDAVQSPEQQADLALDVATDAARGSLLGFAEGSFQKVAADIRLAEILAHNPAAPQFFHRA